MKIRYLGTAAAEGWPAVFCRCDACVKASELKGKNIRTRSQVIINDDLLIDFPADSYLHALQNDIDLSLVKNLLVTHSHSDHFYAQELVLRGGCYAHNMSTLKLNIFCNKEVKECFDIYTKKELEETVENHLEWHIITPFDGFEIGDYTITALPAKHTRVEDDMIFLIQSGGKTLLYCNDTGRLYDSVYDYLVKNKISIDIVSFDCTSGPLENGNEGGHMGIADNLVVKERLEKEGICDGNTKYIITHFSHNGGLLHDELVEIVKPHGLEVAFDGMKIDI